ncbi:Period circadian protein-like protein 3, partial [Frankliniella fusca]
AFAPVSARAGLAHQLALGGEWGAFRGVQGLPPPYLPGCGPPAGPGLHHFPHVLALPQHAQHAHDGQGSESGDRPAADSLTPAPLPLPPHAVHPLHPLQHHIHNNNNLNNNNNNNNNNNITIDSKDGKESGARGGGGGRSPTPSPPPSSASPAALSLRRSPPPSSASPPPARDGGPVSPPAAAPASPSPPDSATVPGGPFSPPSAAPQPFSGLHPALLQQHNSAFLSLFMGTPLPGAPWLYSQLYQPPHFQGADLHSMALQLQQRHAAAVGSLGSLTDSKMSSGGSDEDGEVNVHDDDKDDEDDDEDRRRRRGRVDDEDEDDVDVAAPCSPPPHGPGSPLLPLRHGRSPSSSSGVSRSPPSTPTGRAHSPAHRLRLKAASPVTALRARASPSKVVWRPY